MKIFSGFKKRIRFVREDLPRKDREEVRMILLLFVFASGTVFFAWVNIVLSAFMLFLLERRTNAGWYRKVLGADYCAREREIDRLFQEDVS